METLDTDEKFIVKQNTNIHIRNQLRQLKEAPILDKEAFV